LFKPIASVQQKSQKLKPSHYSVRDLTCFQFNPQSSGSSAWGRLALVDTTGKQITQGHAGEEFGGYNQIGVAISVLTG
jgi:hypothetical protein